MSKELIDGFILFKKYYDLLLWIYPVTRKFPNKEKYVLGEKIQTIALNVLENIIMIASNKEREKALIKADIELEKLRILIRLSNDLKLLDLRRYEYASKKIIEIGKILGGIIKSPIVKGQGIHQ
ncbi:four helix bundle protein [Candidatus Woesearchaeota archaeon CG10_big_fil_rev_8_21_14_0_10_32_9]|nr:MAG: four helix bundle protein [Candidatus Woesearchaeota archaeon CG10_big_fil_rev_8_21_14_0_10_32_9]